MEASTEQFGAGMRELTIGTVVSRGFWLLSTALLLRFLPLEDYGRLALILSVYALLAMVVSLAQRSLVVAHCAQARGRGEDDQAQRLFESHLLLTWLLLGLLASAAVLARPFLKEQIRVVSSLDWLLLAGAFTNPLIDVVIVSHQIEKDFRGIKYVQIVQSSLRFLGYALGVAVAGWGLHGAIAAHVASGVIPALLFGQGVIRATVRATRRPSLRPMLVMLRTEGKWVLSREVVTNLHANLRPWVIQLVLGLQAVALFKAARAFIRVPVGLVPTKRLLLPLMSWEAQQRERLREMFADAARHTTWLYLIMGGGLLLISPLVLTELFPQYQASLPLVQLMVFTYLTAGVAAPQGPLFYALRSQRAYFFLSLLNLVLMLLIGIPLMLAFDIRGMAAAVVFNGAVTTWIRHVCLRREFPEIDMGWRELVRFSSKDRRFLRRMLLNR